MREVSLKQAELFEVSTEILEKGGLFCFKAHGSSMYPFIRDEDVITVQPVEVNSLNVGNIAFYRSTEDRLVAHRVVGKKFTNGQCVLMMRGDAGLNTNEQVPAGHVIGRVMSIQRGQKVIQFDNKFWKITSRLWITSYPLSALFLEAVLRSKKVVSFFIRQLLVFK